MFCRKRSGTRRWQASVMKCVPLSAASEKSTPVVAEDADLEAVQAGRNPVTSVVP